MLASSSDVDRVLASLASSGNENRAVAFLIEAVKDSQETIRAIDTKVGILLAALAIPLPTVEHVFTEIHAHGATLSFATVLGGLGFVAWVGAALVAVRALTGVGNASMHVRAEHKPENMFYAGGLYAFGPLDALLTRGGPSSRTSIEEYAANIPMSPDAVNTQLAYEVLSLAYIRDLKIHRQKIAFEATAVAIVLAVLALVL